MSAPSLLFVRNQIESAEGDLRLARAASSRDPLQALRLLHIVDDTLRTARAELAAYEIRIRAGGRVVA